MSQVEPLEDRALKDIHLQDKAVRKTDERPTKRKRNEDEQQEDELLFQAKKNRFVLFPIVYKEVL